MDAAAAATAEADELRGKAQGLEEGLRRAHRMSSAAEQRIAVLEAELAGRSATQQEKRSSSSGSTLRPKRTTEASDSAAPAMTTGKSVPKRKKSGSGISRHKSQSKLETGAIAGEPDLETRLGRNGTQDNDQVGPYE